MTAEVIIRKDDGTVFVRNIHQVNWVPCGWKSDYLLKDDGVAILGYTLAFDGRPVYNQLPEGDVPVVVVERTEGQP